ncbi:unnamed protein product [Rotaria sordida]|nr:unnamed protein product [Rotaria sordida]
MATPNTRVLTLLDPDNKHDWCDTQFNNKIFIRFIDSHLCHNHICTYIINQEMDVHFFFPDTQLELIMHWPSEHSDTRKYIYCRDQTSIKSIRETYGRCIAHKIFPADDLAFEIGHVQVALLRLLAKQAPEESPQRDEIASKAIEELECLSHMLKQMMIDQISEQPVEHN